MYNTMKEKLTKLIKNKTVIVGIVAIVIIVSVLLFLYQRQLEQERTQIVLLGDQDITLEVGEEYEEKGFAAVSMCQCSINYEAGTKRKREHGDYRKNLFGVS